MRCLTGETNLGFRGLGFTAVGVEGSRADDLRRWCSGGFRVVLIHLADQVALVKVLIWSAFSVRLNLKPPNPHCGMQDHT